MLFKIGDYVTRDSYQNDTVFKIMDIDGEIAYLKGVNVRLYADSDIEDLRKVENVKEMWQEDKNVIEQMHEMIRLDRDEYFYLPGKILHIDGDQDYLERCMKFYKEMNVRAYGMALKEESIKEELEHLLVEIKPDVVVITGHDAYYKRGKDPKNLENYKNTKNFIGAIQTARQYEKSQDKLIIVAGACQSNYEELIKAGANFASSPKRINIHALDPAIIASSVSLSDRNKPIDLLTILKKTKYGSDGIGGIITNGCMYVGYPR